VAFYFELHKFTKRYSLLSKYLITLRNDTGLRVTVLLRKHNNARRNCDSSTSRLSKQNSYFNTGRYQIRVLAKRTRHVCPFRIHSMVRSSRWLSRLLSWLVSGLLSRWISRLLSGWFSRRLPRAVQIKRILLHTVDQIHWTSTHAVNDGADTASSIEKTKGLMTRCSDLATLHGGGAT